RPPTRPNGPDVGLTPQAARPGNTRTFNFRYRTERVNMPSLRTLSAGFLSLILLSGGPPASTAEKPATPPPNPPVSYYKQIRPISQPRCQGCHQPAKDGGGYVMTEFKRLLAAGDSGKAAIVPGKPGQSELVLQITAKDGKAEMPKKDKPLHSSD